MPRDAFVLKMQRELCHPKYTRKVSGLSRNGSLVYTFSSLLDFYKYCVFFPHSIYSVRSHPLLWDKLWKHIHWNLLTALSAYHRSAENIAQFICGKLVMVISDYKFLLKWSSCFFPLRSAQLDYFVFRAQFWCGFFQPPSDQVQAVQKKMELQNQGIKIIRWRNLK